MEIVELAREFMCRVFDIDNLTVLGILGMALAFILKVISMEYKVKAWFRHKRMWSRLAVCLTLLIIAVYFDFYVIAVIIFVVVVCLSAVFPFLHEWIILYAYRRNYRILERKTIERWMLSTSAKLRFYALRIKNSRDEQRQLLQVALLDKSKNWDIYDFEYKKYVLPHLDVLFRIGAVKSFREECARLSQFEDTSYMQTYKTYLAYDEMEYEEMAKEMEPASGEDDAQLVTLLNNLCAYEASGEKEKMECVVKELLHFKRRGIVHCVLYHDLMHYYDEIVHDKEKADALAGEIEEIELGNFGDYLILMDVAFMHYRRIGHQAKINELVEKIIKKNEQMQKGESCLLTKIRMLYVIMDNGANWQDYSIRMFQDRLTYLNYNARVGAEFIKETFRFLRDMETNCDMHLRQEKFDDIIYDFNQYASRYVDELEAEISSIDRRFIYKKKEYLLLKLEMLKFIAKDDIVAIRQNNDEVYDRIADMCEYNDNHREYLHFLVVHADDILSMDKQIMEHKDFDIVFANSQKMKGYLMLRKTYINNAENIVCRIVDELDKRAYDKSVVYYILYVAYFYMMLGNKERCMFFFSKFERYDVTVKNWTVPIQQIYAELHRFNNSNVFVDNYDTEKAF